jgi:hypothetical protein
VIRSITRYTFDKGAILLAQGFPDFDPADEVLAAAEKAMRDGRNQYGMTWGQPSLTKSVSQPCRDPASTLPIPALVAVWCASHFQRKTKHSTLWKSDLRSCGRSGESPQIQTQCACVPFF